MRVVDKRREPFTRFIGRGSPFGNPFTHIPLHMTAAAVEVGSVTEAVQCFEEWARGSQKWAHIWPDRREKLLEEIAKLKEDDVLGCYGCKPCCHGDVIIQLWNEAHNAEIH